MKKYFFFIPLFFFIFTIVNDSFSQNTTDENGLKQGKWEAYYSNGQLRYEGQFIDGKEVGIFKHYDTEGNIKFENDFIEPGIKSKTSVFAASGKQIAEGCYVNRQRDGEWRFYDEASGVLILTEEYSDGWRDGVSKSYFLNGKVQEITTFKQDFKEGLWQCFLENGILQAEVSYFENQYHGEGKFYYPNGILREEGSFEHGRKVGTWRVYDDEGNLLSEDLFLEE